MTPVLRTTLLATLVITSGLLEAADWTGSAKWFGTLSQPREIQTPNGMFRPDTTGALTGRFRGGLAGNLHNGVRGEMVYEWVPSWSATDLAGTNAFSSSQKIPYRVKDFSRTLVRGDAITLFHNLDRLNLSVILPFLDITVGRQAISGGTARVSPMDVLTPFNFDSLDTEYRSGVDGVTLRIPLGSSSELTAGAVLGPTLNDSAAFVRAQTHALVTDFRGMLVSYQGSTLAGAGLEIALFGAGVWWEGAYTWVRRLHAEDQTHYFRTSLGVDYSPWDKISALVEYHFNGAGTASPNQYQRQELNFGHQKGGVFYLGRQYLSVGLRADLTALTSLAGNTIVNLGDDSWILSLNFETNFAQDWTLNLGGYLGFGLSPTGTGSPPTATAHRSEFGSFPSFVFTSLRYYY